MTVNRKFNFFNNVMIKSIIIIYKKYNNIKISINLLCSL